MSTADLRVDGGSARLSGELTFATVTGLYAQMESASRKEGIPAKVDLQEVTKIDSAGLALLLEWQSRFRKQAPTASDGPGKIEIANPPEALLKIARLCDAEEHLLPGAAVQAPSAEAE